MRAFTFKGILTSSSDTFISSTVKLFSVPSESDCVGEGAGDLRFFIFFVLKQLLHRVLWLALRRCFVRHFPYAWHLKVLYNALKIKTNDVLDDILF